jgi:hypothetical protein
MATNFATMAFDSPRVIVQDVAFEQPGNVLPSSVNQPKNRDLVPELSGVAVSSTSVSASRVLLFFVLHGSAHDKSLSLSVDPFTLTEIAPLPVPVAELSICAIGMNTASTSLISPSVMVQVSADPVHAPLQYPNRYPAAGVCVRTISVFSE